MLSGGEVLAALDGLADPLGEELIKPKFNVVLIMKDTWI
jgi:hypothetical protein